MTDAKHIHVADLYCAMSGKNLAPSNVPPKPGEKYWTIGRNSVRSYYDAVEFIMGEDYLDNLSLCDDVDQNKSEIADYLIETHPFLAEIKPPELHSEMSRDYTTVQIDAWARGLEMQYGSYHEVKPLFQSYDALPPENKANENDVPVKTHKAEITGENAAPTGSVKNLKTLHLG